jgi:hypothetical protein
VLFWGETWYGNKWQAKEAAEKVRRNILGPRMLFNLCTSVLIRAMTLFVFFSKLFGLPLSLASAESFASGERVCRGGQEIG